MGGLPYGQDAKEPPLRGKDSEWNAVSGAGGQEQKAMPNAWWCKGLGGANRKQECI